MLPFCCFLVFCSSFLFHSSFALFHCDLMTIFSVIFGFLCLFYMCIYYIFLVCGYHEEYIQQHIYIYIFIYKTIYIVLLFSHSAMSDSLQPPQTAAFQASLSFTISQSLLKLMSIEQVMPSNHLILCCPLLLLPSIFPSIRVFSNELALHIRWPKYWRFSFSINPSNEYSGLIFLQD